MQSRLEKVDKFECSNKILFECETKHNAKIKKAGTMQSRLEKVEKFGCSNKVLLHR
jgi:hypothetical protein